MSKKPVVQGGVDNYLGKQPQVVAPRKWQSSPDSPETELAYITKAEKDLLIKKDLHGSLKGKTNMGPSGIMSLDGYGSFDGDDPSKDTGMSGAATSAAEAGRNTADTLAEGASYKDVQDYRNAAIAAGAGQRVNPGFFDSRNTVSPDELEAARRANPDAFAAVRGNFLGNLVSSGGVIGSLLRQLGRRFGIGKEYDEPTYDMSSLSGLPLGGSAAFENLDIRDKFDRRDKSITGTNYPGANIYDEGLTDVPGDSGILSLTDAMTGPNYFKSGVFSGRFNPDVNINTKVGNTANRNMASGYSVNDYFNRSGLTGSSVFDKSPYGNIGDYLD